MKKIRKVCVVGWYVNISVVWLFFGVYRPTREFFTDMETSPLPVKGCKFWPMLGTHGHWAVRFFSMPHLLWHGASVYNKWSSSRTRDTLTYCRAFDSGTCFYDLGLSWPVIEPRSPAQEYQCWRLATGKLPTI